jgi:hypothetical protein
VGKTAIPPGKSGEVSDTLREKIEPLIAKGHFREIGVAERVQLPQARHEEVIEGYENEIPDGWDELNVLTCKAWIKKCTDLPTLHKLSSVEDREKVKAAIDIRILQIS